VRAAFDQLLIFQPSSRIMRVFLSYSRSDKPKVAQLTDELEVLNCKVWVDQQLTGGEKWWNRILHEIRNCDIFVFCLSPNSIRSRPCQLELGYALSLDKSIMPVALVSLSGAELPATIRDLQVLEFLSDSIEYRKQLSVGFRTLPPSPSLPDRLPPEPELPHTALSEIDRRLDDETIEATEQIAIFDTLRELYEDSEQANAARKALLKLRHHYAVTNAIALSIDSLMRLSPSAIRISNCAALRGLTEHILKNSVTAIAFPPGSESVTVALSNGAVLDSLDDSEEPAYIEPGYMPAKLAFHPTLPVLFLAGRKEIVLRSTLATRHYLGNPYEHKVGAVIGVSVKDYERVLAFQDYTLDTHESAPPPDGQVFMSTMSGPTGAIASGGGSFHALDVAPNGELLAVGGEDRQCLIWDLRWQRPKARLRTGTNDTIRALKFHPGGKLLFAGDYKGRLAIWDCTTGALVSDCQAHDGELSGLSFSADGNLVATGGRDGRLKIWDAHDGRAVAELAKGSGICDLVWSPVGDLIAVAGRDGLITLWRSTPIEKMVDISTFESRAVSLAWSDNAARLAASDETGKLRIWSL
jgi:WD40 repeat protein